MRTGSGTDQEGHSSLSPSTIELSPAPTADSTMMGQVDELTGSPLGSPRYSPRGSHPRIWALTLSAGFRRG